MYTKLYSHKNRTVNHLAATEKSNEVYKNVVLVSYLLRRKRLRKKNNKKMGKNRNWNKKKMAKRRTS